MMGMYSITAVRQGLRFSGCWPPMSPLFSPGFIRFSLGSELRPWQCAQGLVGDKQGGSTSA